MCQFLPQSYDYHRSIPLLRLRPRSSVVPPPISSSPVGSVTVDLSSALDEEDETANERRGLLQESREEENRGNEEGQAISASNATGQTTSTQASAAASTSTAASPSPPPDDDNPCPICYTELDPSGPLTSLMVCPCDHVFHTPCLTRWMHEKLECPVCRAELPIVEEEEESEEEEEEEEQQIQPQPEEEPEERRQDGIAFYLQPQD